MLSPVFRWFEARIDPYPSQTRIPSSRNVVQFIYSCTAGVRHYLVLLVLLTVGIGAYEAYLFKIIGELVDWMTHLTPETFLVEKQTQLITMLFVVVGSTIWVLCHALVRFQILQGNFPMRLRWNFHRLMLDQSLAFYSDEFAGRVSAKVMQTALAVRDTLMVCADMAVYILVYFLTSGMVLFSFDPWLVAPFLVWIVLYAGTVSYFLPRLGKTAQDQADARALMTGRVTDAYSNISTVKLFSHGQRESEYTRKAMQTFMGTVHGQMRLVTKLETSVHLVNVGLIVMTCAVSIGLWMQNQVGVGALAAATAMGLRINGLSHWIMWELAQLFEHIGTVQDGLNTLSRPPAIVDAPNAQPLKVTHGEIRFQDVQFAYNDRTIFAPLSLHIRPGEKIGLVGRSGAGKSSIVNLLLRFYDIQSGKITIDGQNIQQVTQASLRAQIGMVTQDTSLLHRSVRENVAYGRPDATESEILSALEKAHAATFVAQLKDAHGRTGLDAHVGERGVKLSGGQRQRIAIARVMLKNAPILILDEATSALDSEVEAAIQGSLNDLMHGKTVIAIAHRLSTIAAMDRLIILDEGKIIEEGSHEQLLAQQGLYAKLWQHQSGGFLGQVEASPTAPRH